MMETPCRFDPTALRAEDAADALAGHFSVSAWTHLSADHRLSLPDGLVVLPLPGDLLIGPLRCRHARTADPLFAGRQVETGKSIPDPLLDSVNPSHGLFASKSDLTVRQRQA